jgi:hypothetical protein
MLVLVSGAVLGSGVVLVSGAVWVCVEKGGFAPTCKHCPSRYYLLSTMCYVLYWRVSRCKVLGRRTSSTNWP